MRSDPPAKYETSARFEPAPRGPRFILTYQPLAAERGSIVFAPPFAEEMNKSRRMVALAARTLAAHGWRVVQVDLLGCGDSAGDFSDATWEEWVADLHRSVRAEHEAQREVWLWGLRAGALLLPLLIKSYPSVNLLLWQPSVDGAQVLSQFLRMRTAAAWLVAGQATDRSSLRKQLARGEAVEVAGYSLPPGVANDLVQARLELAPNFSGRIVWLDVANDSAEPVIASTEKLLASWRAAGHAIEFERVVGAPFWQTVEIAEVPKLLERTLAAIDRTCRVTAPTPPPGT